MTKEYHSTNELIDLRDLFLIIRKKKIFILISIISFSIAFVVYSKINYTEPLTEVRITLKDPQSTDIHFDPAYNLYDEFIKNLLSYDNLINYLESQNDEYLVELKKNLSKKNLSLSSFFRDKLFLGRVESKTSDSNIFYLRHPKNLNGVLILNDYTIFITQEEKLKLFNYKKKKLSSQIENTKKNIAIATKLGFEKPFFNYINLQNINFDFNNANFKSNNFDKEDLSFYNGTIVLSEKLIELNRLENNLNIKNVEFNTILDKASFHNDIDNNFSILKMALLGMLTGFLLSSAVSFLNFSSIKK